MHCPVTHKRSFQDEFMALEALMNNHAQNFHKRESGPINIYQCDHCGDWHFTSKGEIHPDLRKDETQLRIKTERLGAHWERKLR